MESWGHMSFEHESIPEILWDMVGFSGVIYTLYIIAQSIGAKRWGKIKANITK